MINVFGLLGACALATISASSGLQPRKAVVNQVIDNTWSCYTDGTDYEFAMNLFNSEGDFYIWYNDYVNNHNYSTNHFGTFIYYDTIDNIFRGVTDSSSTQSSSWSNCWTTLNGLAEGLPSAGVYLYASFSSSSTTTFNFYLTFISGMNNNGRYYLGDSSLNYMGLETFKGYQVNISNMDNLTYVSYTNNIEHTLDEWLDNNFMLSNIQRDTLHDSQVLKGAPLGAVTYYQQTTRSEFVYNKTTTKKFAFHNWTDDGYNSGYDTGYSDGVSKGYQEGYSNGYTEADNQDSTALSIFTGIINVGLLPVNFFLNMLNFEVFGINIGAIVSATLTIAIVVIIIRVITGKKND